MHDDQRLQEQATVNFYKKIILHNCTNLKFQHKNLKYLKLKETNQQWRETGRKKKKTPLTQHKY